jgi:hypothetical protein
MKKWFGWEDERYKFEKLHLSIGVSGHNELILITTPQALMNAAEVQGE